MEVFRQMIRQLSNLAHCTSPTQANFGHYFRLLDQLARVKIGVVLVELTRTIDDDNDSALELLCDLIQTILKVVHMDHPEEVSTNAVKAISACLEEFDSTLPIPVLDEILQPIAAGPLLMVTNPAAVEAAALNAKSKKKMKMPPLQIQQKNPSYLVAAAIVRRTVDRLSTPMAAFLNGLWNGDATIVSNIDSSQLSAIIYELHKIAPQILTTVIGTITTSLQSPQVDKRLEVVKLLGRLFYSKSSQIGSKFRPCFREWLRRSTDIDVSVRESMVKYLVAVLSHQPELAEETSTVLNQLIMQDPNSEVRIQAIHQVCELAYNSPTLVSAPLLQAIGNRVSSKTKVERRDALTGLAQIVHKHYIRKRLSNIQSGGDDCAIEIILQVFANEDDELDEMYGWIAQKVFQSACFTDDTEMRNRVVQIVDDVLLGHDLSGTSNAVGCALIVSSLQDTSAEQWMMALLQQRARLQQALREYLEARETLRAAKAGTEKALKADAQAMERLELVSSLTDGGSAEVLNKLHAARDNHIFRILATIASPTHSAKARTRAFEDLPKRTKSLGDSTSAFVKRLARRCAMGGMVNVEIVGHSILLAQECFNEGDGDACVKFLSYLQTVADVFPTLFTRKKQDFGTLLEFFSECRQIEDNASRKVMEKLGIVTRLSSIMASVAPSLKVRCCKLGGY